MARARPVQEIRLGVADEGMKGEAGDQRPEAGGQRTEVAAKRSKKLKSDPSDQTNQTDIPHLISLVFLEPFVLKPLSPNVPTGQQDDSLVHRARKRKLITSTSFRQRRPRSNAEISAITDKHGRIPSFCSVPVCRLVTGGWYVRLIC